MKPGTSSDEDGYAGDEKRCKRKSKKIRETSKMSRKHRARDTSSEDSSASDLETSDAEKRMKSSRTERRRRSRRTVTAEKFATSARRH